MNKLLFMKKLLSEETVLKNHMENLKRPLAL